MRMRLALTGQRPVLCGIHPAGRCGEDSGSYSSGRGGWGVSRLRSVVADNVRK